MPERNIIDTTAVPEVAESELDDVRLPAAVPSSGDATLADLKGMTYGNLIKFTSEDLILVGDDAPAESLLVSGRRAIYFRTGDTGGIYISADGSAWTQVSSSGGDSIAQGVGITITEETDGTKTIAVSRPFTSSDESKLDAIAAQATRNIKGDGIDIANDGTTSVDDDYVGDLIAANLAAALEQFQDIYEG